MPHNTHVKQPPNVSEDVEQSILGTLITDFENCLFDDIGNLKGYFYLPKHEFIYDSILYMSDHGKQIDLITIGEQLKKVGTLEKVGGVYYLSQLCDKSVHPFQLETYSKILIEYGIRRKVHNSLLDYTHRFYDVGEDVFDLLDSVQQELFDADNDINRRRKSNVVRLSDGVYNAFEFFESVRGKEDGLTGLGTGFTQLDRLTGGFQDTDLIIIAARPSMGKTAFALNVARNSFMIYEKPIGIFSFEMSADQLSKRILTSEARVDSIRAATGRLNDEEFEQLRIAKERLKNIKIFIDDSSDVSVGYVVSRSRQLVRDGACAIIVDYLQLMSGNNAYGKSGNREQEISQISRTLKGMARDLGVPVIALSQLSRAVESRVDKRPQLSDLRESGAIEQDADLVMFIYRAWKYGIEVDDDGNSTEGIGELLLQKQRNGPLGVVQLAFIEKYARFENLTTTNKAEVGMFGNNTTNGAVDYETVINPWD